MLDNSVNQEYYNNFNTGKSIIYIFKNLFFFFWKREYFKILNKTS